MGGVAIIESGGSGGVIVAERPYFGWEYRDTLKWITAQCQEWRARCPGVPFYGRLLGKGRYYFGQRAHRIFTLDRDRFTRQGCIPYCKSLLGY